MSRPVSVLISGYDSPEGPAFDQDGNLYFVNWLSSAIVRLTPGGMASNSSTPAVSRPGSPFIVTAPSTSRMRATKSMACFASPMARRRSSLTISKGSRSTAPTTWCSTGTASSTSPIPGGHQPKTRSAGSTASSRMVVWSGSTMDWPFPMALRSARRRRRLPGRDLPQPHPALLDRSRRRRRCA